MSISIFSLCFPFSLLMHCLAHEEVKFEKNVKTDISSTPTASQTVVNLLPCISLSNPATGFCILADVVSKVH